MPLVYLEGVAAPLAVEGTLAELRQLVTEKVKSRFVEITVRSDFLPPGGFTAGEAGLIQPSKVVGILSLADEHEDSKE